MQKEVVKQDENKNTENLDLDLKRQQDSKLEFVKRNAEKLRKQKEYEKLLKIRGASSGPAFDKKKVQARVSSFNTNYREPIRFHNRRPFN